MSPEPKPYEPEVPQTEGRTTPPGPRQLNPVSLFHVGAAQRHDIEMIKGEAAEGVVFVTTDQKGQPLPAEEQVPTTKASKGRRQELPPG